MFCNDCKKNPATIHYQSIVNGVKSETDLCAECAAKRGLASFSPFSLGDFFPHAVLSGQDQIHCGNCGMTLSEFKRSGLVGCAQCYKDMRVGTEPILRQVQKGLTHIGRRPVGHAAGELPDPAHSVDSAPVDPTMQPRQELQERMNEAISSEDFETAAALRDELRALETGEQKSAGDSA